MIIYNLLYSFLIFNSFLLGIFIQCFIIKHIISKISNLVSKRKSSKSNSINFSLSNFRVHTTINNCLHHHYYRFFSRILEFSRNISYLFDKIIVNSLKIDACPLFIRQVMLTALICYNWLFTNIIFSQKRKGIISHNKGRIAVKKFLLFILIFQIFF